MSILLFTSGTTNMSKGVMRLTIMWPAMLQESQVFKSVMPQTYTSLLLPLHHTFENTVGLRCSWSIWASVSLL
jgi:long-chain acyl-CoA synthetase